MNLVPYLRLVHSLDLKGGSTETIFPKVEGWFEADSDRAHVLRSVGFSNQSDKTPYRSIIDYVFCSVCPEYRAACFRFYADKGPRFVDLLPQAEIRRYEARILAALEVLQAARQQKLGRVGWPAVRKTIAA